MPPNLPRTPGSYALLLFLPRRTPISVGRLGQLDFKRGYYVYVGSAFGPGGLGARLGRHRAVSEMKHWHIDYLRAAAGIKQIWVNVSKNNREHQWAQSLMKRPGQCQPIPGFGCSDCLCPSHLFFFNKRPDLAELAEKEAALVPLTIGGG